MFLLLMRNKLFVSQISAVTLILFIIKVICESKNGWLIQLLHFKNEVTQLINKRSDWQENQFKTSNEMLYDLLAQIYELYLQSKGGEKADASKRAWLVEQCEEREITFKSNKPTLIQLITKLVFYDSLADSRRVNSYARVLNAAAQSPKVLVASDVPEFIRANGGIEEVRAATAKNTKSPSERAEFGRKLLADRDTIQTITNEIVKTNAATVKGKVILLVGIATAQGKVEVKDICFEVVDSKFLIVTRQLSKLSYPLFILRIAAETRTLNGS